MPFRRSYLQLSRVLQFCSCIVLLLLNTACAVIDYQSGLRDSDNDAVATRDDECPDTEPAVVVNRRGCDLFDGVIDGLVFETSSLDLNSSSMAALDELARGMVAHPQVDLEISAHTDNRGVALKNLELSKRRVMVVVEYLVNQGVASTRLLPIGFGESRPLAANETEEGRRLNRRVEIAQIED